MYNQFFSLKQSPFSIAPDPRYLFMSERHREALAHLLYGVGSGGGFVLLTGEIGAGKTTVCRCFIEQIPDNCRLAYIFNPQADGGGTAAVDLRRVPHRAAAAGRRPGQRQGLCRRHQCLPAGQRTRSGKNNVLVIDEAQNLSADVLEQLRLLTNLETSERKLLQIILIGQPELRTMLARPELEQLAQRVIARYHLGSLSEPETGSYIAHRHGGGRRAGAHRRSRAALIGRIHQHDPRRAAPHQPAVRPRAAGRLCREQPRGHAHHPAQRAAGEVFAGAAGRGALARAGRWWPAACWPARPLQRAAAWQLLPERAGARPGRCGAPAAAASAVAPVAAAVSLVPLAQADEQRALRELAALWGAAAARRRVLPGRPAGRICAATRARAACTNCASWTGRPC